MSAFAGAVRQMFRDPNISAPAIWRSAASGQDVPLRVIAKSPDETFAFGAGQFATATMVVDVMVSAAPDLRAGDLIAIGGEQYQVQGEPLRDRERLTWSVDLRPVRGVV